TTTNSELARPATTPPSASSATASSVSSTAASKPVPTTTKRPHGRTTPTPLPLDLKRHGVSDTTNNLSNPGQQQSLLLRTVIRGHGCAHQPHLRAAAYRPRRLTVRRLSSMALGMLRATRQGGA